MKRLEVKEMSRLDELLQQYCSNGVEYVPLNAIAEYASERIDAKEVDQHNYIGVDNLLQNKMGKTESSYVPTEGRLIKYQEGDVLIGNIRPYLKKIWLAEDDGGTNGDVLVIHITKDGMLPKYLYYCLSSDDFFNYDVQHSKGSKMPRGDKSSVMAYVISVPPLPVQREIVRILDKFTELETELETELQLRKKQYEYYRDQLLTFRGGGTAILTFRRIECFARLQPFDMERGIKFQKQEVCILYMDVRALLDQQMFTTMRMVQLLVI